MAAVAVTLTNAAPTPVTNVQLSLSAPIGWTIQPSGPISVGTLPGGRSNDATWSVTPPAGTLPGSNLLSASVTYTYARYTGSSSAT